MTDDQSQNIEDGEDHTFDPEEETVNDAWEGVFLQTSWGYDQTNVNFAQITEVSDSGKTVVAQLVYPERVSAEKGSEQLRPSIERFGDEFRLHVRETAGDPAFRGSYPYIQGDKDKGTRMGSFIPFSNEPEATVHQTPTNQGH